MEEGILYAGEHTWPGLVGSFCISLAWVAALFSAWMYFIGLRNADKKYLYAGRIGFGLHALSVIIMVGLLFLMLLNGWFEYHYVMQHSNRELETRYIFASFWEGQEGSFLVWSFWHVLIGLLLIKTAKQWEPGVMFTLALVQIFLISMVLGKVVYLPEIGLDFTIGLYPFEMTRLHPDLAGMPFTQMPDYLSRIDGRGLNPALQNAWMTIHPPTLFLGFALTVVPFCYAVAGLLMRDFSGWFRKAIPWTFTGVAVLGCGILMGGAWAYEALNFGGFWAWDPVENASLVPWITLTAGAHLLLLPKKNRTIILFAYFLLLSSFILVLYSTFLTRSGVLGDASVHSFTDLGLSGQLLLFLFFFMYIPVLIVLPTKQFRLNFMIIGAAILVFGFVSEFHWIARLGWFLFALVCVYLFWVHLEKRIQTFPPGISASMTRDFWIYIAGLIFVVSALHLTLETSKPVLNKLLWNPNWASGTQNFNPVQGALTLLLLLLMGSVYFIPYAGSKGKFELQSVLKVGLYGLGITLFVIGFVPGFSSPWLMLLAFGASVAFSAAMEYVVRFVQKQKRVAATATAHAGFALIILGSIVSAGHQQVISNNKKYVDLSILNPEFNNNEHVMLYRGDTVQMDHYALIYHGDSVSKQKMFYEVEYLKRSADGWEKEFTLYPSIIASESMGNVAEPSTKHFIHKDIFTHVSYVDIRRMELRLLGREDTQYEDPQTFKISLKDTIWSSRAYIVFSDLIPGVAQDSSYTVTPVFQVNVLQGEQEWLSPGFKIDGNRLYTQADTALNGDLVLELLQILPEEQKFEVKITLKKGGDSQDFIIMKAIVFPGINLLWIGCFLMVIGSFLSVYFRVIKS
jgi:cytochrome c-type biogenesis protein CcmF